LLGLVAEIVKTAGRRVNTVRCGNRCRSLEGIMTSSASTTVTDWEHAEIDRANASALTPVVFVHGLWLLSSSWQGWRDRFEEAGYTTLAPGWPDDPATVEEAYRDPSVFAHKMVQGVTDHFLDAISYLEKKPAVIGHSFGGLIVQKIADEGASVATVAIDNAPIKGVLPLPAPALKSGAPVLGNPANRGQLARAGSQQVRSVYPGVNVTYGGAPPAGEENSWTLVSDCPTPSRCRDPPWWTGPAAPSSADSRRWGRSTGSSTRRTTR
jgi:pimeloyl-ACP methyl ester carboxylesterase